MSDMRDYDRVPLTLVALLAAFLLAGVLASRFATEVPAAGATLPDLSGAHVVEVRDASDRTVLSGEFREHVDALGNMERDATLIERGGRHVIGKIEVAVPGPNAMAAAQELDVDIIELSPNAKYSIFIDDHEVAAFNADDRGSIDMKVHSPPHAHPPQR